MVFSPTRHSYFYFDRWALLHSVDGIMWLICSSTWASCNPIWCLYLFYWNDLFPSKNNNSHVFLLPCSVGSPNGVSANPTFKSEGAVAASVRSAKRTALISRQFPSPKGCIAFLSWLQLLFRLFGWDNGAKIHSHLQACRISKLPLVFSSVDLLAKIDYPFQHS